MMNHVKVWDTCIQIIKNEIDAANFQRWFVPIKPMRLDDDVLTIQVPNKFFFKWIEDNYVDILRKAIVKTIGNNAKLEYQILVDNHRKIGSAAKQESTAPPKAFSSSQIKNPFVIPGIKKINIDAQLNPSYTYDNYVVGKNNELAAKAGIEIINNPGANLFVPLVIFGDVGLGKTHLAQAIGNETKRRNPNKNVLYITTERFTNQVVQAIKEKSVGEFINFYQLIDTLIVDDVHFLSNRPKTQEVFFNIFNHLHQNNKQIILTMDRPPKELVDVDDRLVSRFKWGLSTELTAPDFETRLQILKHKMKRDNIVFDEHIQEYICYNIENNIRELEGVLTTLIAMARLNRQEIDMPLAKQIVNQFIKEGTKEITVTNIKKLVADYFKLSVDTLHSKTRKRDIVIARQLSMYFAKTFTNNSYKVIGKEFGGKDHSTVIYSVKVIKDLMDTDQDFKKTVEELEKQVQLALQ